MQRNLVVAAIALWGSVSAMALSPPPMPIETLEAFYEAMNGDQWHRNDGWLDPEVDVCDWYGITCVTEWVETGNFEWIGYIHLPDNNLQGEFDEPLIRQLNGNGEVGVPSVELDLSDNAISGELPVLPVGIPRLTLAGNRFEGPVPSLPQPSPVLSPAPPPTRLEFLDLSRNALTGPVPESWSALELRELNLADNKLDAGYLNAFEAMSPVDWSRLNLAGNDFTGELTNDIFTAKLYRRDHGNIAGGLDVCFNDFIIDNPDVEQWIESRHVGGPDYHQCLARERLTVDASVSGSWFHPERSGEGISLMLLENGSPLLYHFGFDTQGRQQWLFELGTAGEQYMQWDRLFETQGTFNAGLRYDGDYPFIRPVARFRLDRVGADALHLHRQYRDLSGCGEWDEADPNRPPPPGLCFASLISDRMDYQRLSALAGTTCDSQARYQDYSGAWFNPDSSGEGFIIEVLPDQKAVVYWFTHKPDDSYEQVWLIGQGEIVHQGVIPTPFPGTVRGRIIIDSMIQPTDGRFGPDFDPEAIEYVDWGRMEIGIDIDGSDGAIVGWESNVEGYGSGSYELERLAQPMLAECD